MEKKKTDKPVLPVDLRIYIDSHLADEIDLKSLAKHYGYSYERFRTIFKTATGTTLHKYISLRSLQYAAKLMRQGANVSEAYQKTTYQTLSGFIRAFRDLFGVSPYEYAASRGRVLMTEPELRTRADFFTVGYAFEAIPDLNWMESGAYWQGQQFPPFDADEFARIGCDLAEACVWVRRNNKTFYVFGWEVSRVQYVPFTMQMVAIPGGDFMVFRAPLAMNTDAMGENIRATWYYAYEQWLPASDYDVDWNRLPFEEYLNDDRLIYIPVKQKESGTRQTASEHPPMLLQGSRGRWDRWEEEDKA